MQSTNLFPFNLGVTKNSKALCHQFLTDNNNKKIDVATFLSYIKDFYSNEDPGHISKYIHGYQEEWATYIYRVSKKKRTLFDFMQRTGYKSYRNEIKTIVFRND